MEEAILRYLNVQSLYEYVNSQQLFFEEHVKKFTEGGVAAPIWLAAHN